jgi:ABC-type uncharacterized transport system substrate-binding protein
MIKDRAEALVLFGDPIFVRHRAWIASLAAKSRLPTVTGGREMAEAGLLMAYGRSLSDDFRHAAADVDKILKRARPADLPVEQPTKLNSSST